MTKPAAKREKVLAYLALLLTFMVLAAGAPAPADAVALPSLVPPFELVGAVGVAIPARP